MKKRDFNFKSVLLVYIILAVVSMLVNSAFGNENNFASLLIGFIGAFFDFAVSRGLIVKRKGSFEDYLGQVKKVNLNFFLVNLLFVGLGFLISIIGAGSFAAITMTMISENSKKAVAFSSVLGALGLVLILSILLNLIGQYANFVVADPRNEKLGAVEAFKKVFKTGFKLLGKTLLSMLKYIILPGLVFIFILLDILSPIITESSVGLLVFLLIGFTLLIFYLAIKFKVEVSDHYLNLYGDYENRLEAYGDKNKEKAENLSAIPQAKEDLQDLGEDEVYDFEDSEDDF